MFDIPSWEVIMGPAPIDWCEENFTQISYIAEVNNTFTNLAYIVAAAVLLSNTKVSLGSAEGKLFLFYCLSLLFTGATSGLFHATLIWWTQKADEIFENWTVLTLFHSSFPVMSSTEIFTRRIVPHVVLVTIGICLIPVAFCEVHLIILSCATVYRFAYCANGLNLANSKMQRSRLFKVASYAIIGFVAWICDFMACSTFRELYLHAFGWHILTGLALYEAGLLLEVMLLQKQNAVHNKER